MTRARKRNVPARPRASADEMDCGVRPDVSQIEAAPGRRQESDRA